MKPKKNPQKDLSKNSSMYFAIGMTLVLAFTYVSLEWKTFYNDNEYILGMNEADDSIDEEVPVVKWTTPPPPPPPPVTPEVITIVDDEDPIIESVIETTEPDPEKEVLKVEDIEVADEDIDVPVIFSVIEDAPIFPGCEKATDKKACFNTMMQKHIKKNFRYPEISQEMGVQGRVNIMFEIQKDGSIGKVQMRSPDKNLEKEAARIISKLPKMTPGRQRGKAVRVPFSIPINFKLK